MGSKTKRHPTPPFQIVFTCTSISRVNMQKKTKKKRHKMNLFFLWFTLIQNAFSLRADICSKRIYNDVKTNGWWGKLLIEYLNAWNREEECEGDCFWWERGCFLPINVHVRSCYCPKCSFGLSFASGKGRHRDRVCCYGSLWVAEVWKVQIEMLFKNLQYLLPMVLNCPGHFEAHFTSRSKSVFQIIKSLNARICNL